MQIISISILKINRIIVQDSNLSNDISLIIGLFVFTVDGYDNLIWLSINVIQTNAAVMMYDKFMY